MSGSAICTVAQEQLCIFVKIKVICEASGCTNRCQPAAKTKQKTTRQNLKQTNEIELL